VLDFVLEEKKLFVIWLTVIGSNYQIIKTLSKMFCTNNCHYCAKKNKMMLTNPFARLKSKFRYKIDSSQAVFTSAPNPGMRIR
jgi:hypothetical protein